MQAATHSTPISPPSARLTEDVKRARELYRYLQPDNLVPPRFRRRGSTFNSRHEHVPSLAAALAPYCQLTALRCNVRKAMLNVMDRDVMYSLAEGSSAPDSSDSQVESVEDPIFLHCSTSVPSKDSICEMTVRLNKSGRDGAAPMFVVPDLSTSQFSHLSMVAGPPYYRFYAGTPITTRDGVNIGSLAVMDTSPRAGLSTAEEEFLVQTAAHIMTYLETNRQAIEGMRSRRMAEALEGFIAGKRSMDEGRPGSLSEKAMRKRSRIAYGLSRRVSDKESVVGPRVDHPQDEFPAKQGQRRRSSLESTSSEIGISGQSSDADDQHSVQDVDDGLRNHPKTFGRAANLLREAFGDLGEDGAVVFLTLRSRLDRLKRSASSPGRHRSYSLKQSTSDHREMAPGHQPASILAYSTQAAPFVNEDAPSPPRLEIAEELLLTLMTRHPGGRLWSFDESRWSSEEEDAGRFHPSGRRRQRRRNEERAVRAVFPASRQVLFTPIWDANAGSFAHAVFVSASLETRPISLQELSFLNSFCSTVMDECSRLDTMKADKQKSDFVGTISHEMRSPLHGILASVEFLADTNLSGFQQSLIDTVDSCGRTLLDTINHVLDFSKVNSFEKHWQASNKRTNYLSKKHHYLGPESTSKPYSQGAPPLLQLFGVTDIAAVLEEVVDGLVLGHTYTSGIDITDTSREARGRGSSSRGEGLSTEEVAVIVDVQQADWAFMTQPGAVRRIILNLTGNALKYTTKGFVTVRLELTSLDHVGEDKDSELMLLTVTDTGRGISPQFLSSRLFIPFAQENALAPGTGLGLSIVHSIVTMLGGTIDVQSQLGQGTVVQVALPLKRPLPGQVSTGNTPHSGSTATSASTGPDEYVHFLQNQASDCKVALYRPGKPQPHDWAQVTSRYVRDWYGLELVDQPLLGIASVVVTEEEDLESLIDQIVGTPGNRPALVVLCSFASRHSASYISSLETRTNGAVEFVSRPTGPYKLAKSIRLAWEKMRAARSPFENVAARGAIPAQTTSRTPQHAPAPPRTDQVADNLQEMDLNSPGRVSVARVVQASETFAASQSSQHAQMAINHPSGSVVNSPVWTTTEKDAYPFPDLRSTASASATGLASDQGPAGESALNRDDHALPRSTRNLEEPDTVLAKQEMHAIDPRILLVDDNKINLKLLETFLRTKRKYSHIVMAENGKKAVKAVRSAQEPFEIVFMDVSMPVMNGFEATRAIRDFEKEHNIKTGAMVIALTGLASGQDQSEGLDSGCDIYMTKPVSFKEVGKLLDNWEAHQRLKDGKSDSDNTVVGGGIARPGL